MNSLRLLRNSGIYAALCALMAASCVCAQQKADAKANLEKVAAANNRFAVELYRTVGKENTGKNVFLSPASVSTALSMTYEGAAGKTRTQMAGTMHFDMPDAERQEGYAALLKTLTVAPGKHYKLHAANALWGDKKGLLPGFVKIMNKTYGGGFRGDISIPAVNKWASDETEGKIKDLLHEGDIDGLTVLILTNAIYFKGDWEAKFDAKATEAQEFHLGDGKTVQAPLMQRKGEIRYAEDADTQMVELPYKDGDLSMVVVLPKGKLDTFDASLTADRLQAMEDRLRQREVNLFLPKFKFEARAYLDSPLETMGMPDAFSEGAADFSGMTGKKDLYIKHVIHEAFIDVNEEGSEAAAATAVIMNTKSVRFDEPPTFRADRPFLFMIVHKASGTILFMGRVENPAA
ncbi:MAG: serpin family protein [Terracidiphilus sp.]|nr:serpin family protein [Terracidiphilus sp.]